MSKLCLCRRIRRYLISSWMLWNFGNASCANLARKSWENGFLILMNYLFEKFIRIRTLSKRCGTFAYFTSTFRSIMTHWKRLRIYWKFTTGCDWNDSFHTNFGRMTIDLLFIADKKLVARVNINVNGRRIRKIYSHSQGWRHGRRNVYV